MNNVFPFRSIISVITALGLMLGLAGCGGSSQATKGNVLHFANGTEPSDLDPQTVTGRPESNIIRSLMQGLVTPDPKTLKPMPGQAESWEVSDDGTVYTFKIRSNAKWSNGDAVTAHDFVRSFQRMLTPSLASEYAYQLHLLKNGEAYNTGKLTDFSEVGAKALDDLTLELTLDHPTGYFLDVLHHQSWKPVHIPTVEKFGGLDRKGSRWTRPENYVGNGPFILSEWSPNQHILVKRSPTYWDAANVKLDGVKYYPIENSDTEERMFRTGQLDVTRQLPLNKIDEYRTNRQDVLHVDDFLAAAYFRVNVTRPQLQDARVRRAIALALDREGLAREIFRRTKTPAWHFAPAMPGFTPPNTFEDNIAKAQALLAEAGFPGGEGLAPIEILYPTSDSGRIVCEALQAMLITNLGIDVKLYNQEFKVYLETMQQRNYDMAWSAWVGDYPDPMTFLDMNVTDGGNNRTGWSNARYDQLVDDVQAVRDSAQRAEVFYEMERILGEEAPVIPLYFYTSVYAKSAEVKGWYPTLLDIHPFQHIWLERAE
ncbi:MAG: peptide ABC transporter substrate-binding protein [Synoicihabitans sp.]